MIHTVSTGDSGFGTAVPAAFNSVVAVGGTTLRKAANPRGWQEKVWSGAGSGCSAFEPRPAWQIATPQCSRRVLADVSAVADPATGVSVYNTFGMGGWLVFGGTSASAPIIAGVYGLKGNAATAGPGARSIYAAPKATTIFDITVGSNGACGGTFLCTAKPGFDGPTGWGTPKGINAF